MPDSADDPSLKGTPMPLDLRHLAAFQQVYLTRDYTMAGHDLNTNRKGVIRMLERLEQIFQSPLFTSQNRNILAPSPFADRLFNDLRFLNSAREALHEKVAEIRSSGRLLRVGSSPAIFRTEIFRTLFRALQTAHGIRTSYIPVKPGETAKALASGICDLHVGSCPINQSRFAGEKIGEVAYKMLRKEGGAIGSGQQSPYVVELDGCTPAIEGSARNFLPLEDTRFLHWLDHPEECADGTRILAPDIPRDPVHWIPEEDLLDLRQPIHIQFLRQHPYEFLPSLVNGLKTRITRQ